jgi:hypothetical protein
MAKCKDLYRGVFTFPVEMKREYSSAYSLEQAKKLMVDKLAGKQGVPAKTIWEWLEKHPGNWEIRKEIEWKEIDE